MQEIHFASQFDFLPLTLTLPREANQLLMHMQANPSQFWIIKPAGSSQGKGIYITNDFNEIKFPKDGNLERTSMVASHYISNPLLIDELKFDLRLYVAVTSIYPLRIYVYQEGLARFATERYQPPKMKLFEHD